MMTNIFLIIQQQKRLYSRLKTIKEEKKKK